MSESEKEKFRLEDEPDGDRPAAPPPPPPSRDEAGDNGLEPVPEIEVEGGFLVEEEPPARPVPPVPPVPPPPRRPTPVYDDTGDDTGIDTRTLAEKRGRAVAVVAGRRAPPEGWPGEALAFPLRRPGLRTIVGAAVLLTLFDLASRANFFLGLLLKLVVLPLLLRWQLHVASMSAGGHDQPAGWATAMDMRGEHLRGIGLLLIAALLLAAPGTAAHVLERPVLSAVLFLLGGLWLAVGALGQAVGQPSLIRPWHVLAWLVRRPLGLLAATAGWWALGLTEWAVWALREQPAGLYVAASLGMRLVGMYLWLLSARALGVVGRAWSPFGREGRVDVTSPEG